MLTQNAKKTLLIVRHVVLDMLPILVLVAAWLLIAEPLVFKIIEREIECKFSEEIYYGTGIKAPPCRLIESLKRP